MESILSELMVKSANAISAEPFFTVSELNIELKWGVLYFTFTNSYNFHIPLPIFLILFNRQHFYLSMNQNHLQLVTHILLQDDS